MIRKLIALAIAGIISASFATVDPLTYAPIFDADINTGDSIVWEPTDAGGAPIYRALQEQVFVDSGAALVIKPGCYIFGVNGPLQRRAGALVVARGGRLYAEGTKENPIVFTTIGDEPNDPFDIGPGAKGLWGGVVMMGKAPISNPNDSGTFAGMHIMEGIDKNDHRAYYGGTNPADFSGIVKYVSIRHGGSALVSAEEVNALTMGGIGSATQIDYVEAFANSDDAFEWFGGNVKATHLVAAFCQDDHFDYDEGWQGGGQYWFSIHQEYEGDRAGEHDGNQSGDTYYSIPTIANVTYIGSGINASNTKNRPGILFRDNAGGHYYNAIVTNFPGSPLLNDVDGLPWSNSDLTVKNSIFGGNGGSMNTTDATYIFATETTNKSSDPQIRQVASVIGQKQLDPRAKSGSPVYSGYATSIPTTHPDAFDTPAYMGAFGENDLWIEEWTALDEMDILSGFLSLSPQTSNITQGQAFDLTLILTKSGVSVPSGSIVVNGFDATSLLLPSLIIEPIPNVGLGFRFPLTGAGLGAGKKNIVATLNLSDGTTVTDEAVIDVQ
ncbi:MAG: T9SS C-terminal target domain-containing protein [Chitinivibrionales bacterium]|nr:T9SS C-terminal target domain-containing protein [Chitinivibrionales bacterium]